MTNIRITAALLMSAVLTSAGMASTDVNLQVVKVGDVANTPDTNGLGSVGYTYYMGKYDITSSQYATFLNAVAASDPYQLYNANMDPANMPDACGIVRTGPDGNYSYHVVSGHGNLPVNCTNWGDAARFCNWLCNGQPRGASGLGTTETGAYTMNGLMITRDSGSTNADLAGITRNPNALFHLPTENEWYKAAYYDPNKGGPGVPGYWLYPTMNDTPPSNAPPFGSSLNNTLLTPGSNYANVCDYYNLYNWGYYSDPTNLLTPVGTFVNSPSPYGTFDQAGEVWQWIELPADGGCNQRGGSWWYDETVPNANFRMLFPWPGEDNDTFGFRIVSTINIPEPTTLGLLTLGAVALLARRRRV